MLLGSPTYFQFSSFVCHSNYHVFAFQTVSRARLYRKWVQKLQRECRNPDRRGKKPGGRSMDITSTTRDSSAPSLPFFPIDVATRLIHMEIQSPDWVTPTGSPVENKASDTDKGLINFGKLRGLAEVVENFLKSQSIPYPFTPDKRIQQALVATVEAFQMDSSELDAEMCKLSAIYEPRSDTPSDSQPSTPEVVSSISLKCSIRLVMLKRK